MQMGAEETGGATSFNNYGREVKFAAGSTPSGFARAAQCIPKDYVSGTNINIVVLAMMNATQSIAFKYYAEGLNAGDDGFTSPWNLASAATSSSQSFTAKIMKQFTVYTIPAASVAIDKFIGIAIAPNAAPSADMEFLGVYMEYTADS